MATKALIAVTVAAGIACALAPPAFSQTKSDEGGMSSARLDRVTQVLDKYIADGTIAGSVSLVYRKGHIVYLGTRGYQDIEAKAPMKRDTIFTIASMTKPITTVAVMILVEEGKLRLDDPVDELLPELANRKVLNDPLGPLSDVRASLRPITVRDLLTYQIGLGNAGQSGIPNDAPIAQALAGLRSGRDVTPNEFMKRLGELPLAYEPGERFMYGLPSAVTGVLIQRVSGMPLDEFFETRIFTPLGMKDTGFFVPEEKRARFASRYQPGPQPGTLVPVANNATRMSARPAFPSAGGGLSSTVDDYLKFARMMLNGGKVDGVQLLSRKSVELMTRDYMTPAQHEQFFVRPGFWSTYGFGFGVAVKTRRTVLGPSVGSYWWNGASGVGWIADPKEELIFLRFIQRGGVGGSSTFARDLENAVYQAIVD